MASGLKSQRTWSSFLCHFLPSLLLLVQCFSPVYSFDSNFGAVDNWILIDENFPSTVNEKNTSQLERFYYAQGSFESDLTLTDELQKRLERQTVTAFHVDFQYWLNNNEGCVKAIQIFKGLQPQNRPSQWNSVELVYNESLIELDQFKSFNIKLYANGECQHSLLALKQLKLRYNSYEEVPGEAVTDPRPFKLIDQNTPTSTQIKSSTSINYLYDCDRGDDSCAIIIDIPKLKDPKVDKYETIELEIRHSKSAQLIGKNQTWVHEVKDDKLTLIKLDDKIIKELHQDDTIKLVVRSSNRSTVSIRVSDAIQEKLTIQNGFNVSDTSDEAKFLKEQTGNSNVTMLMEYQRNASIPIIDVDSNPKSWPCYQIHYLMQSAKTQSRFILYAQTVRNNLIQNHRLFSWIPADGYENSKHDVVEFCLGNYLHSNVFQHDSKSINQQKFKILLETEGVNDPNVEAINQRSFISIKTIDEATKPVDVDNVVHYFFEKSPNTWNDVIPKTEPLSASPNVITVGLTPHVKSYQLSTKWLHNNPKHSLRPALVRLLIPPEYKQNTFQLNGQICDEIMECLNSTVTMVDNNTIAESGQYVDYALKFDPHPNNRSKLIRLVLHLNVPPMTNSKFEIEVKLINMGDPCYENVACLARTNTECTSSPDRNEPNDFDGACHCQDGWIGTYCEITDHCKFNNKEKECTDKKLACRNSRENNNLECVCEPGANIVSPLEIYKINKCEPAFDTKTSFKLTNKTATWHYQLDSINTNIYDLCFRFNGENTNNSKEVITVNISAILGETTKSSTIYLLDTVFSSIFDKTNNYFDLCLNELVQYNRIRTTKTSLTVSVDTITEKMIDWKAEAGFIYSKKIVTNGDDDRKTTVDQVNFVTIPKIVGDSVNITDDKDNKKGGLVKKLIHLNQPNVIGLFPAGAVAPTKLTILSDWIRKEEGLSIVKTKENKILLDNSFNTTLLTLERLDICRPRLGLFNDCQQLNLQSSSVDTKQNFNDWYKLLSTFDDSDKFQFRLVLSVDHRYVDEFHKNDMINTTLSIYNGCGMVDCGKRGTCNSVDALNYKCICNTGFEGTDCEIDVETSCNKLHKDACKKLNSDCVPLAEGYSCNCPIGYNYNRTSLDCERMRLSGQELSYSIDQPSTWLNDNKQNMKYLPKHFPLIADPKSKNNKNLYYSVNLENRLTIGVEDPAKLMSTADYDVCVIFQYYVAPGTSIRLMLEQSKTSIQLFTIQGSKTLDSHQLPANGNGDLSAKQTLCLKSLLNLNDQTNFKLAEQFQLSFVAKSDSIDDAVAIQITKSDFKSVLELKQVIDGQNEPKSAFHYIGAQTSDQENVTAINLDYQWPVQFPKERWSNSDFTKLEFKKTNSETKETAILESHWIRRPIQSFSTDRVYLSFWMEQEKGQSLEKVQISLIDSQRRQISTIAMINANDWNNALPINNRLRRHFSYEMNPKVKIELDTVYKVVFEIDYVDKTPNIPSDNRVLFLFDRISFGDPCIYPQNGTVRACYNLEGKVDPFVVCNRFADPNTGELDYNCKCDEEHGLTGKDCRDKLYCKYRHTLTETTTELTNGNEYCKKAKCEEGPIDHYKFHCHCTGSLQYFDFDTQECKPISKCVLEPCDFQTETCEEIMGDSGNMQRQCSCKYGYQKPANGTGKCEQIEQCKIDGETCPDPLMKCFSSVGGNFKLCQCPKGYVKDNTGLKCRSQYCNFPGFHTCSQECLSIDEAPYYKCSCNKAYYNLVKNECQIKDNAPEVCKKCVGKYQVCMSEQCTCIKGFTMVNNECVPNQLVLACPHDRYKLNNDHEIVCDCLAPENDQAANETSRFWKYDTDLKTCTLMKSICEEGETGHSNCSSLGARCIPNPYDAEDYACECQVGRIFPNNKRMMDVNSLISEPRASCFDVCDLPLRQQHCLSIGARCNPLKLWKTWNTEENVWATYDYCDCVPGTFFNGKQCEQDMVSLLLSIQFRWSHQLENKSESMIAETYKSDYDISNPDKFIWKQNPETTSLNFIDPIGLAKAQKCIYEASQNQTLNEKIIHLVRREIILEQSRQVMSTFQLQKANNNKETVFFSIDDNDLNKITINVSVRTSRDYTRIDPRTNQFTFNQKLLDLYRNIMGNCNKFEKGNYCTIPFLGAVLLNQNLDPKINQPCESTETCQGMSDCIPSGNSSYFSCKCNTNYFKPISWLNFMTSESTVVFRNERCKSKELCYQCLEKSDNQQCVEEEPIFDITNKTWSKKAMCSCLNGFRTNPDGQCVAACLLHNCSSRGRCALDASFSPFCTCDEDYYGLNCENEKKSNTGFMIAVIILSVALGIVLVAGAVFFLFCRRNSSNSSSSTHQRKSTSATTSITTTTTTANKTQSPITTTTTRVDGQSFNNQTNQRNGANIPGTPTTPSATNTNIFFQSKTISTNSQPPPEPAPRIVNPIQQQRQIETKIGDKPLEPWHNEFEISIDYEEIGNLKGHRADEPMEPTPVPTFQLNSQQVIHYSSNGELIENNVSTNDQYQQNSFQPEPEPEPIYSKIIKKQVHRNQPKNSSKIYESSSSSSSSSFSGSNTSEEEQEEVEQEEQSEFRPINYNHHHHQEEEEEYDGLEMAPPSPPPPPPPPMSFQDETSVVSSTELSQSSSKSSSFKSTSSSKSSTSESETETKESAPEVLEIPIRRLPENRQRTPILSDRKLVLESQERPNSFRDAKAKIANLLAFQSHRTYPINEGSGSSSSRSNTDTLE